MLSFRFVLMFWPQLLLVLDEIQQLTDPCCRQSLELKLEDISQCFFWGGRGCYLWKWLQCYKLIHAADTGLHFKTNAWMYGSATCTEIGCGNQPQFVTFRWLEIAAPAIQEFHHRFHRFHRGGTVSWSLRMRTSLISTLTFVMLLF